MKKEKLRGLWILIFAACRAAVVLGQSNFRCAADQFRCDNEKCITFAWRCDWEDDCGDNSDEKGCDQQTCSAEQFRCDSGKCIRRNWVCDHEDDCGDNSDEKSCSHRNATCSPSQFHCVKSNRCIPKSWMCDHDDDCGDGSDERNCKHATCGPNAFTCSNKKCIQARWQCDEDDDCGDGSDEAASLCGAASCKPGLFLCNNKRCILHQWVCDGDDDCGDASEEKPPTCSSTKQPQCQVGEIACKSGMGGPLARCILEQWKCDGDRDCQDGSDEEDCPAKVTCSAAQFTCKDGSCIDINKKCNGQRDCALGEDEEQCALDCGPDDFKCGLSRLCIPNSRVCDRTKDCYHGEDEPASKCFINECVDHNGHCTHYCNDSVIGYSCSCKDGYELGIDKRTCLDVNECIIPGMCSQYCENKKGGYKCSCMSSYVLEPNGRTCKAIGPRPFLVLSDRKTVRSLNFDSTEYRSLISGLSSVIWVTYDIHMEVLYWSDTREKAILKAQLYNPGNVKRVVENLGIPDGVAVDWIGRKLYWVDTSKSLLGVSELDGTSILTLVKTGVEKPRAIAIDPTEFGRTLYWTDWGTNAKIEAISMDGDLSTRRVIHPLRDSWPNGLTIDFTIRKLYWVDAKQETIECSNMDGSDRRMILKLHGQHPFAITVFEDYVFWIDWQSESIRKANKFTGDNSVIVQEGIYAPMGLEVYHPMRQPAAKNPCGMYNGGCSHLCLLSTSPSGYGCRCPDGVSLLPNGQTCNTSVAYTCTPSFCFHGGICSNGTDSRPQLPRCKCPDGYTGRRCEVISPCKDCVYTTESPVVTAGHATKSKSRSGKVEDKGLTAGMVLGVVIGILTIAAIVGYLFYRYLKREYRERKMVNFENPVYQRTTDDMVPIISMEECNDSTDISQC